MIGLESAWKWGAGELEAAGVEEAAIDAWYLAEHCFHTDRVSYLMEPGKTVPPEEYSRYQELIGARKRRVPLQYLTGSQEFMGLSFLVNESVLIPRQDTETLAEQAVSLIREKQRGGQSPRILDLCTGSGCVIISLAALCGLAEAWGADISEAALLVAAENAVRNRVAINWIKSDLFDEVEGSFDVVVSNPPYIRTKDLESLMPEVGFYEPREALDGSGDGLSFYRRIAKAARSHLNENGVLLFEIGSDQGEAVLSILKSEGYHTIRKRKDLAGLDRVVWGFYH